jgi:hypothetical protein
MYSELKSRWQLADEHVQQTAFFSGEGAHNVNDLGIYHSSLCVAFKPEEDEELIDALCPIYD